jgi:hypothetical protein
MGVDLELEDQVDMVRENVRNDSSGRRDERRAADRLDGVGLNSDRLPAQSNHVRLSETQ